MSDIHTDQLKIGKEFLTLDYSLGLENFLPDEHLVMRLILAALKW